MIRLRLVLPRDLTAGVVDLLDDDDRCTHLVVLRGAAVRPDGDVVECDVAREAADDVLAALRALGVDGAEGRCGISLEEIDASLSATATTAEEAAPGSPDDGIVWPIVVSRAEADARASWAFYAFLCLATAIASVAVITDSAVLVVGAMVVGPEFGPVSALAVAVALRRRTLAIGALRLLLGGFAVAIATTCALALVARLGGWITVDDVTRARPLTAFIWAPDRWSFVVALLAGCAGVLSLTAGRSNVLVGVFISVTTVPAAGNFALALALWAPDELRGSALQLLVNLVGMTISGAATLAVQRLLTRPRPGRRDRPVRSRAAA